VRAGYWAAGGLPEDGPNASANELGHGADEGELGQNQRRKGKKKKTFCYFQKSSPTFEFKRKFEFKQTKTMQQHVCNSKLL
jgi:hypothetical protein